MIAMNTLTLPGVLPISFLERKVSTLSTKAGWPIIHTIVA
jgi:hypothetical protein